MKRKSKSSIIIIRKKKSMGKLTINKQEVIKAIKTFKFNITNKAELRAIKKIDLNSIEFEEVKATIQIGHLHGSMIAAGARDGSQSPDFVTSLDQDFHTDAFPLLVDGSEDAAFAYAIANNYLSDGALEYPFKKSDLNKAAITLASKYYESYLFKTFSRLLFRIAIFKSFSMHTDDYRFTDSGICFC